MRLTRLVCLPCQPSPAAAASGFSITGAVSTKTLTSALRAGGKLRRDLLQPALDHIMVVTIACIDGDMGLVREILQIARIALRAVVHAEAERRFAPPARAPGIGAALRRLLHPCHGAVMAGSPEKPKAGMAASGMASDVVMRQRSKPSLPASSLMKRVSLPPGWLRHPPSSAVPDQKSRSA